MRMRCLRKPLGVKATRVPRGIDVLLARTRASSRACRAWGAHALHRRRAASARADLEIRGTSVAARTLIVGSEMVLFPAEAVEGAAT